MTDPSNLEDLERDSAQLVTTPGFRFLAPAGTSTPVAKARDSLFVDSWPLAWLPSNEALPGTELLRLTTFQRAVGDEVATFFDRPHTWAGIDIPAGWIACMIGWESGRSDTRVIGQSIIAESYLRAVSMAIYAR